MRADAGLEKLQKNLWKEYNEVIVQEELLWAQISRCQWLQFGDRNSKFFRTATLIRRKRNKIEALVDEDGTMLTEYDDLLAHTVNYFRASFQDVGGTHSLVSDCSFPPL